MTSTRIGPATLFCVLAGGIGALLIEHFILPNSNSYLVSPKTDVPNSRSNVNLIAKVGSKVHASNDVESKVPSSDDAGPRVYSFNGKSLQRLYKFCTWAPPSDCAMMNTAKGPVPMYLLPKAMSVFGEHVKKQHNWEPHISSLLYSELKKYPDAGLVDLGTNIGPFSLEMAKFGRQVLAVDAVIDNVIRLCQSVHKNGFNDKITIVYNPLSDKNFNMSSVFSSSNLEIGKNKNAAKRTECGDLHQIMTVRLDDLLPLVTFKRAVLLMDVQGFEYFVINGGHKFFKTVNVPSIVMEWVLVKNTKGQELIRLMNSFNYFAYQYAYNGQHKILNTTDYLKWGVDVVWLKKQ